jgi:hypothetical protein
MFVSEAWDRIFVCRTNRFPKFLCYLDLFIASWTAVSFDFFCINIPVKKYIFLQTKVMRLNWAYKMWNNGDAASDCWWHTQTLILRILFVSSPKGGTFKWQILSWLMQFRSIYVTFISQLYFKMLDLCPSPGWWVLWPVYCTSPVCVMTSCILWRLFSWDQFQRLFFVQ